MCVISCILKCAISIVNSLLMIMGISLMAVGGLLLWGMNYFMKNIYDVQGEIQKLIKGLGVTADGSGVFQLMQQNASTIGIIAFSIGVVLVVLAVVSMVAVCCCSIRMILIVICALLCALALGLIILIIVYGSNPTGRIVEPLENVLQKDIINKYEGISATNPESIFINLIQITSHCCGLINGSNFNTAPKFNRTVVDSSNKQYTLAFPLSCCNYKQDYTIDQGERDTCIRSSTSPNMNIGCWVKLKPAIEKYINYCFAAIGITIAILVAAIIVTIILIKCAEKLSI